MCIPEPFPPRRRVHLLGGRLTDFLAVRPVVDDGREAARDGHSLTLILVMFISLHPRRITGQSQDRVGGTDSGQAHYERQNARETEPAEAVFQHDNK